MTEDLQGLVTEDVALRLRVPEPREEFHDGSVHRMIVQPPRQGAGGRGAPG